MGVCGSAKSGDKNNVHVCSPLYMCLTPCPPCRVWDIRTGQVMNDLLHHKAAVKSLKFTTDTLVTGSDVSGCKTATPAFEVLLIVEANQFG